METGQLGLYIFRVIIYHQGKQGLIRAIKICVIIYYEGE
jgi:hypothetical protein